ncbi:MAG: stage V sporulation protein AC [Oscillospiraceae bacterium]|nr:stage V sporulation protein AC [Oscillospiraceae bacterium]
MNITNKEYGELAQKHSPATRTKANCIKAFLIGGVICVIGQTFTDIYTALGFSKLDTGALVSMTLIFISAILTGLRLYDKLARHGGAGTLVPITGFANSVVAPALEYKSEGFVTGIGSKMFSIAGPVLIYGITASVLYGILYYLFR